MARHYGITKIFAMILAADLLVALMPSTVYAASETILTDESALDENAEIVNIVYNAIQKSAASQSAADFSNVEKLINSLTSKNKLRLYVKLSQEYYYKNYLSSSNKFFDPIAYLAANPDVAAQAAQSSDSSLYALEHYLTVGIFEGRSPMTDFDPAVAILVNPNSLYYAAQTGSISPDNVYEAFVETTGNTSTASYNINWDQQQNDGEETDKPIVYKTDTYEPDLLKPEEEQVTRVSLRNKNSSVIPGYPLPYDENVAKSVSGTNAYTLMIYMCGSDQESDDTNVRVTKQLISMLKAGSLDNVNVLVCVGGTDQYSNNYMGDTETGINNDGVGIYYVDGSQVTAEYEKLDEASKDVFDKEFSELSDLEASDLSGVSNIINENTFKKITQLESIDMGDANLLAGFINLAVDLFPAADYGLILSDHGGGLNEGVCISADASEKGVTGTYITTAELESALNATIFGQDDEKMGLLCFDACLMGSMELAYTLQDYYEYMLASEEVTWGQTDYAKILSAINSIATTDSTDRDLSIAKTLLAGYTELSFHTSNIKDNTSAQTMAVYSGEKIANTMEYIDAASKLLSEATSDEDMKANGIDSEIFEAVRKSILSCYSYNDASDDAKKVYSEIVKTKATVDVGEFAGYLIENLGAIVTEVNNSDIEESIKSEIVSKLSDITSVLGQIETSGYVVDNETYSFNGEQIASMGTDESGNLIVTSSDDWETLRGENTKYSGISLVLPLSGVLDNDYYSTYTSGYNYSGSLLASYITFMNSYNNYINTSARTGKVDQLKGEMASIDYTKLITPVKDSNGSDYNTLGDSGSAYIAFKVAESYEAAGLTAPADSLGSPLQDMLETGYSIDISVVHKEQFNINNNDGTCGTLVVNMLCGEAAIAPNTVSLDNSTVSFAVGTLNTAVTGYKLSGTAASGNNTGGDTWQYVLSSDYYKDSVEKDNLITAFCTAMNTDLAAANCLIVTGGAKTTDTEYESVQHVFALDTDSSNYSYKGSVLITTDETTNSLEYSYTTANEISAYHYVLVDVDTDETGTTYEKKCLETDYEDKGITSGYYTVDENLTISVIEITQKDSDGDDSIINNGYTLSMRLDSSGSADIYSDIAKIDETKYDSAPDSGNGLLEVGEDVKDTDLETNNNTSHDNDTTDGLNEYTDDSAESNLAYDDNLTTTEESEASEESKENGTTADIEQIDAIKEDDPEIDELITDAS